MLMSGAGISPPAIGPAVAAELDWPLVESDDPLALHAMAASVLGRRQHLLAVTPPLTQLDQQTIRGDLLGVRFLDLSNGPASPGEIVAAMRREFGV